MNFGGAQSARHRLRRSWRCLGLAADSSGFRPASAGARRWVDRTGHDPGVDQHSQVNALLRNQLFPSGFLMDG